MPSKQDLFGGSSHGVSWAPDHPSNLAKTQAFEDYLETLNGSLARSDEGRDVFVRGTGLVKNARPGKSARADHDKRMSTIETLSKSLTSDQLAAFQGEIDGLKSSLAKDWEASFPESGTMTLPTQLAPVDLEMGAKKLVPRQTPLVNSVPRNNTGKGSAVQFRRILGWSNAGVGGTPDIMPFMNSEFPAGQSTANLPSFGGYAASSGGTDTSGLGLRRGQKITYAADSQVRNYTELGLSDSVSWKAQFIGEGFEDIRQLSATALLWSHKMGEERALLYGRGISSNGYTGPITAPGNPTVAAAAGTLITAGTYYVVITAVGSGGESATNATQQSVTTSSSNLAISVTLPSLPSGATGFNIYCSIASGTGGPYYFQQFAAGAYAGQAVILTALPVNTSPSLPSIAGTIDTTANPNGYDGFLTILLNPAVSGYVGTYALAGTLANSVNSVGGAIAGTTPCGDTPWQTAFQTLYGASTEAGNYAMSTGGSSVWPWAGAGTAYGQKLLADPDVVYVDGAVRAAMGQFVRKSAGGSTAYRITMQTSEATGGLEVGGVVNGIANQVTGKMTDFDVHPYMPVGASLIWSKTLPVPDSEISNTFEVRNVQDYMMYPWPVIQYTYDASTYQLGTFVPYAPAWSGALVGLVP